MNNKSYLEKGNTDCFKGLCAAMVVLCHLCSRTGIGEGNGLGPIFSALGYLGVSGFMFMSGFGLTVSLMMKGGGYLSAFLKKRVLPIYALMALLSVIYYVLKTLLSEDAPKLGELIQSFIFGDTVISFGWYFQSIILIYLLYYVAAFYVTNALN